MGMSIILIFLSGYFFILALLLAGYFLKNILFVNENNSYGQRNTYNAGHSLLIGLILFVTLYAIIKSNGNTVFIFNVLIFAYIYAGRSSENNPIDKRKVSLAYLKQELIQLTVYYFTSALIVFFFLKNYFLSNWTADPHEDVTYYSNITSALKERGAENTQGLINILENTWNTRQPYHYFEMWFSAGYSDLFGFSEFLSFLVIPNLFFYTIILSILNSLSIYFGVNKHLSWVSPLLIFIHPFINWSFVSGARIYTTPIMLYPKSAIILMFILWSASLFVTQSKDKFKVLLFLPIASFIAFPGIIGGICLFGLIHYFRKKNIRSALKIALPFLILSILILSFYYLNGAVHPGKLNGYSFFDLINGYFGYRKSTVLASVILFLLSIALPLGVICILFFGIIGKKKPSQGEKNTFISFFIFSFAIWLSSLIAWAIAFKLYDSLQFFFFVIIPSFTIISALLILYTLGGPLVSSKKKLFASWLIILLLFIGFIVRDIDFPGTQYSVGAKYSKDFVLKVERELKSSTNQNIVALIRPLSAYTNSFDCNDRVSVIGSFIKRIDPAAFVIPISTYKALGKKWNNSLEAERVDLLLKESPIINFFKKQKKNFANADTINIEISDFIRDNKINFLIASKDEQLSKDILNIFSIEPLDDSLSGIRFYTRPKN